MTSGKPDGNLLLLRMPMPSCPSSDLVGGQCRYFSIEARSSRCHAAYAAAFFLLGDSPKDAINICLRQLKDLQLATAIARVRDDDKNTLLQGLVKQHILPIAMAGGHRWLAHWALWILGHYELAGKALLVRLSFPIQLLLIKAFSDLIPRACTCLRCASHNNWRAGK